MPVIPIMPSINTCMSLTTTTTTMSNSNVSKVPEVNTTQLQALADVCSTVNGKHWCRCNSFQSINFSFFFVGAESMTMPIAVMNSLVSATKVITNDTIPNPIIASHNSMALPTIPVPVSSLGIPVIDMKTDDDDDFIKPPPSSSNDVEKMEEKPLSDVECIDGDNDKHCDAKKCEAEPMPVEVEDDNLLDKTIENGCETDIDVNDDGKIAGNGNRDDKMNSSEPMECASVASFASFASPKHTMTTDIVMTESISV